MGAGPGRPLDVRQEIGQKADRRQKGADAVDHIHAGQVGEFAEGRRPKTPEPEG